MSNILLGDSRHDVRGPDHVRQAEAAGRAARGHLHEGAAVRRAGRRATAGTHIVLRQARRH